MYIPVWKKHKDILYLLASGMKSQCRQSWKDWKAQNSNVSGFETGIKYANNCKQTLSVLNYTFKKQQYSILCNVCLFIAIGCFVKRQFVHFLTRIEEN